MENLSDRLYNPLQSMNDASITYNNMLIAQDNSMKMRIAGLQYQDMLKEMGLTNEINLLVGQQAKQGQNQQNMLSSPQAQQQVAPIQNTQPNIQSPQQSNVSSPQVAPAQATPQASVQVPNDAPFQQPKLSRSELLRQQAMKESDPQKAGEMIAYADKMEQQEKQTELKQAAPLLEKMAESLIKDGDNEGLQKFAKFVGENYGIKLPNITVTSKGETETKGEITDLKSPMLAALKDKIKDDPAMVETLNSIKVGDTVKVKTKNGKPVSVEVEHGKSENAEQLTRDALRDKLHREPTAGEIKNQMQADKIEQMKANRAIIELDKEKGLDIPALADAVANGQDARKAIKGSMGNPVATKVESQVLKEYPKFNFAMSDANYVWQTSPINMRTLNYIEGSIPRISRLTDQVADLKNTNINTINKVMNAVNREFGKPEITNFEANRNSIVLEVSTALSGSSQGSDTRIKLELENLKSARSPQQITGAIKNLNEALLARLDAQTSPLYPLEVVRGEKTQQEWSKELYKKYKGDYTEHNWSSGTSGTTSSGNAPGSNQPPYDVKIQKAPTKGAKLTDMNIVDAYMKAANDDKNVARQLAKKDGWGL